MRKHIGGSPGLVTVPNIDRHRTGVVEVYTAYYSSAAYASNVTDYFIFIECEPI